MKTKTIRTRCNSCEVMYINGIRCHEHGCPEAYKDELRECKWCGCEFEPEDRYQNFCSEECAADYNS